MTFEVAARDYSKAYRFRTTGSLLDLDFGGTGMVISGYPDAYFTGFQTFYMRFGWYQNQVANAGRWMWNDNIFELEESEADFVINTDTGKIHIGSRSWTVL